MADAPEIRFDQVKNLGIFADTRQRAARVGLVAAVAELFEAANIDIDIIGADSALQTVGLPTIAVGDHSKGLESLLIVGACAGLNRPDMNITAKPFAFTGQMVNAIAPEEDQLIGLVPSAMARDKKGGDMGVRLHRAVYRKHLPTLAETAAFNRRSIGKIATTVEAGRLVTIFPTGGVYDAATTPWRKGVGQAVTALSDEVFDTTLVAPFEFEDFKPRRIMTAIAAARLGIKPRRQELVVKFGPQETLGSIFDGNRDLSAEGITEVLRQRFEDEFAPVRQSNQVAAQAAVRAALEA